MDEPLDPRLAALPGAGWTDLRWLLLLLVLVAGLRTWQVTHTEVLARDSVGYILIAWRLEHEDWRSVLPSVNQHPGYPLAIVPLAAAVRAFYPDDPVHVMHLAAQLADVLFSLLLIFPVYYLGKELFDRRVGFWAVVLLQCLPATGRLMVDGLSEPVFLFFAVGGLCCACRGLRTGRPAWFAGAGLLGALAYLTRVEGALVVASTGLVLLAFPALGRWKRTWWSWTASLGTLVVSALVVAGPYMATIQHYTVKPIKQHIATDVVPHWSPRTEPRTGLDRSPLPWAIWLTGETLTPHDRAWWALKAIRIEVMKATLYVLWLPALLGLVLFRDRLWRVPGVWVPVTLSVVLLGLLYRVALVMGYLSERHLLLVIVLCLYPAVATVAALVGWLSDRIPILRSRAALVTLVVLAGLAVAPLPRTLATLHGDRRGFRLAGEWINHHAEPGDEVVDPYAWAAFYAGQTFLEAKPHLPAAHPAVTWVVLEENGKSNHDHLWWLMPRVRALVQGKVPVEKFPSSEGNDPARVCVYRLTAPQ
jgi:hypothetical protein